jgi:hypothetical protein
VALGVLGEDDAGATHFGCKHVGERCRRGRRGARSCCSGVCQPPPGGGRRVCTKTTSPDPACAGADACCPGGCTDCSRRGDPSGSCFCGTTAEGGGICWAQNADECGAECTTSDDCGPDAVCVATTTCCSPAPSTGKVCTQFVQRCKVRT